MRRPAKSGHEERPRRYGIYPTDKALSLAHSTKKKPGRATTDNIPEA